MEEAFPSAFWGEMAPCEHVLQLYSNDDALLDALYGFVRGGLIANEAVIVIATPEHRDALVGRLEKDADTDVAACVARDQLILLDAALTVARFMENGWPQETQFREVVSGVLRRAYKNHRNVRAFGEMVALLWERGHQGATVQLESLWNKICGEQIDFSLFCAYPKSGLTEHPNAACTHILQAHTRVFHN